MSEATPTGDALPLFDPISELPKPAADFWDARRWLDVLYPGRPALLLTPLCAPTPHTHSGKACDAVGKRPLALGWNVEAVARWQSPDADREAHLNPIARHVASGGNVGWVIPPGVLVLDSDTLEAVAWLDIALPDAPMQTTAKGAHFVVAVPLALAINAAVKVELAPSITVDVRSAGRSQIVVEPSIHATGAAYTWRRSLPADLADLLECPAAILDCIVAPAPRTGRTGGARKAGEGERNAHLYRIGCAMRGRGCDEQEIRGELHRENSCNCVPPLDASEVDLIVTSVMKQPAGAIYSASDSPIQNNADDETCASPCEDKANALRIAREFGDELRWCSSLGWIAWTGTRWEASETQPLRIASRLGRVIYREAGELSEAAAKSESEAERTQLGRVSEALSRWAKASEAAKRIKAALDLARVYLEIALDALDADPFLLNCENGTIDLHTGNLRPHRREDFLTKTTEIVYDASARSELWDRVLERAIPESPVREFLQRYAGYTALGGKGEDVLLVIHGPTRTAKGTIQGAIARGLGEYANTAGLESLADRDRKDGSRPRPELVCLRGARMVNIYETGRELRLDDALVKTLSGSDEIRARELYKSEVTFKPTFALWIATNHRPRIPDDDDAIWERIREIPFDVQIPEAERDPTVRARLADPTDAGPAVLAWIVKGALAYQRDGLVPPDRVRDATAEYREAMDPLCDFLTECCVLHPEAWTKSAELRATYETWARETGAEVIGGSEFTESLRRHGCNDERKHAGRGWLGIGLLDPKSVTP